MTARRHLLLAVVLLAVLAEPGWAQLEMGLKALHSRYVQFEPLVVTLAIRNSMGHDMVFEGDDANARLEFFVNRGPNEPLRRDRPLKPKGEARLKPGGESEWEVDLLKGFSTRDTGPYVIQAEVVVGSRRYESNRVFVDVVPGFELQKLEVGEGSSGHIFSLLSLHRGRGDYLFLRIDESSGRRCNGVYELGRLLRTYEPTMKVDGGGYVHCLHQAGPTRFAHSIFSTAGVPLSQEFHESDANARLEKGEGGRLTVKASKPMPVGETTRSFEPIE